MSREELEEERRLFYVALTRAKKQATLSYSISRYRYGNSLSCEPSRFLEEIPAEYIDSTAYYAGPPDNIPSFPKRLTAFNVAPPVMQPAPFTANKKLVSVRKANTVAPPVDNSHLVSLRAGMKV